MGPDGESVLGRVTQTYNPLLHTDAAAVAAEELGWCSASHAALV